MRNIIITKNTDCSSGNVMKMNNLTYRIGLSAVEVFYRFAYSNRVKPRMAYSNQ